MFFQQVETKNNYMLAIKKKSKLISVVTNYRVLTSLKKSLNLKKSNSHSVFLRAPKHFNIGKLKIKNHNHKYNKSILFYNTNIATKLIDNSCLLFNYLVSNIKSSILVVPNSYQITIKSVVKLEL